ncbi:hypothetical protein MAM1_0132d06152 [Mucor ambiguus]|uniref:Uncharacterized protein n=1 Tax=Mucor ambiguus TaxID=91626 RepID=A0A0C9MH68_9FUNG|nr:hypothetical protein MAM1_0132d06152 [Mucor ambiguus]
MVTLDEPLIIPVIRPVCLLLPTMKPIIETPSRIAACTVQISAEKKQSTPNDQANTIQGLSTHLARNFNKEKGEQQSKDDMKYYSKHNQIIQLGDQHQRNTQQPNQDNGYELNDESDEEEDIAGDDEKQKQGEEASGDVREKKKILCKIKTKQRIMEG